VACQVSDALIFTTENTEDTEMIEHKQLTEEIIGAAIEVHREFGPGLLELAYEAAMAYELTNRNIAFERQSPLSIQYKSVVFAAGYRVDFHHREHRGHGDGD
jgi:hypothetical protein